MAILDRVPELALPEARPAGGITAPEFLTGLLIAGGLIGVIPNVADTVGREGWAVALARCFDIDAAVVVAFAIALKLALGTGKAAPVRTDFLMAVVFAATLLVPHRAAGWLALGILGAYGAIMWRDTPGRSNVAVIALGISVHQAWGKALLALLAPHLTVWDATLAAGLIEGAGLSVFRFGNVIEAAPDLTLIVVASCLSGKVVLQGWLCGLAVRRYWCPEWQWRELSLWMLAAALLIALNVVRLAICAVSADFYNLLHSPLTGNLFEFFALCVAFFLFTRCMPDARQNAVPS